MVNWSRSAGGPVMVGRGLRIFKGGQLGYGGIVRAGQRGGGLGSVLLTGAKKLILPPLKRLAKRVGRKILRKGYRAASSRLGGGQKGKGFGVGSRVRRRIQVARYKRKRKSYLF